MIFSELYSDGDNFADEGYAARFKVLLHAIHHNLPVKAEMLNRNGKTVYTKFIPKKMEYSEKDDKFRVAIYRRLEAQQRKQSAVLLCGN